ncbi:MAG: cytochrome P450 [Acidimicrobiia bacterium]
MAPTSVEADEIDPYESFDASRQFAGTVAGDVRDPYPRLAQKRRDTPVEHVRDRLWGEMERDAYWVYTYDDVSKAFRDDTTFSSVSIRELMGLYMGPNIIVGLDEPEHRRHRNLVAQAFRQKSLAHWETDLVLPVVDGLIDRILARGNRAELVRDLTYRYPIQVIAEILGLPREDHLTFHRWAMQLINVAADPVNGIAASEALRDYFMGVCDERRREPRSDVISDVVHAELDGERLDEDEILSFLRLLLPAGAETTYRASGNFIFGLLSNPDQMEALRRDRSLMPQAVEEAIRWETPLLITSRRCVEDTVLHDVEIPSGCEVILHTGSANHDETRWDDADAFDIFREAKPHIGFGAGVHMCIGMHLARLELRVAVERLLDRLPNLRLDPDADDPHIHGEHFRSPTSLPVLFGD